jgi:DNA replication protein DnaC
MMMMSNMEQNPVIGTLDELYPGYAEFEALPEKEKHELQVAVPHDAWISLCKETRYVEKQKTWTPKERDEVTRGLIPCPACVGGWYREFFDGGELEVGDRVIHIYDTRKIACDCQGWKHVWKIMQRDFDSHYHYVNLDTLKPNLQNKLPKEIQQVELDYIREHRNSNFFFLGPSGTGKSTLSFALLRAAYERDLPHFWKAETVNPLDFEKKRWIWRNNFNTLLQEFNEHQWNHEAPEPSVTAGKIAAAREAGYTPVLILEEVDKLEMNKHRINFLLPLIDKIIAVNGQLVMTTNLKLHEFIKYLTATDDMTVTAEPIIRRLTENVRVRDYFEMLNFHSKIETPIPLRK